jgi:hypothetical protein
MIYGYIYINTVAQDKVPEMATEIEFVRMYSQSMFGKIICLGNTVILQNWNE